ncbi:dihydrolipoyl dehydrogenase [Nocardia canadensis]|uniref:dihydrolipoyl dehydrogenase n=1 Tax=Nocardia canadensis TaxID=3065238 RepID=UPI00292CF3AC|nr:dihydrolipoyl dehydrogenase [Nocardia canadensis]
MNGGSAAAGKCSDVLILGGGSGGYACALRAAQLGLSVTLVEADKLGGTCLHRGCIPTKALLRAAEVADTTRNARSFGVSATYDGIDLAAVYAYRETVVKRLYQGLRGLLTRDSITVVTGTGQLTNELTVTVDGLRYAGNSVVLATGSRPRVPAGIALGSRIVTSDQALDLDAVPQSAIVLGGGVIGIEFASLWASFGADVTIVEALPRILAAEDPWSSKQVTKALRARGITVRTDARVAAATEDGEGVRVTFADGEIRTADVLLVAVGRAPRIDGLSEVGIGIENGCVATDERLRTTTAGVYAVGDLVAGPQLAHRGFQHGMFVADEIAGNAPVPIPDDLIPRVVYSHPEVASVGLTENAARDRYSNATVLVYDLAGNGKSQILRTGGGVKVVRAGDSGPVVGVHLVGDRVGESIGEAQLSVAWEALPEEIAAFVHAHPSQNEALGEAMLALAGRPLHTHR